jgi:RNA polymerase sigma factor (sigma-70 family)
MFSEKQVIEGCLNGDKLSQKALYNRFAGKMLAICNRYLKDLDYAEDAFQDAFVKVFANLNKFNFQSTLETWMTRIFINEAINKLRTLKKLSLNIHIDDVSYQLSENNLELPNNFDYDLVMILLEKIPENYKIVLMMYAIDGYNHKEIAEKLNMPESTSRSSLTRARHILWQLYNKEIIKHESRRI